MAPHSSTLAWKIPRTEEPGGLQSMGSRRVGYDFLIVVLICISLLISDTEDLFIYLVNFMSLEKCLAFFVID